MRTATLTRRFLKLRRQLARCDLQIARLRTSSRSEATRRKFIVGERAVRPEWRFDSQELWEKRIEEASRILEELEGATNGNAAPYPVETFPPDERDADLRRLANHYRIVAGALLINAGLDRVEPDRLLAALDEAAADELLDDADSLDDLL